MRLARAASSYARAPPVYREYRERGGSRYTGRVPGKIRTFPVLPLYIGAARCAPLITTPQVRPVPLCRHHSSRLPAWATRTAGGLRHAKEHGGTQPRAGRCAFTTAATRMAYMAPAVCCTGPVTVQMLHGLRRNPQAPVPGVSVVEYRVRLGPGTTGAVPGASRRTGGPGHRTVGGMF